MNMITDIGEYVFTFTDKSYYCWLLLFPNGTTHVPPIKTLNSVYYKQDGDKFYRWSSTCPCWEYCAKVNFDVPWQRNLIDIEKGGWK